jgi:hypothetical protein
MWQKTFIRHAWLAVLGLFQAVAAGSCEYRPRTTSDANNVLVLEPDSIPSMEDVRLAPDRLPQLSYLYQSSGEDFQLRFPGPPKVSSAMIPSPQGQIELITIAYDYSITKAYWASYSDYPTAIILSRPARQILQEARNSVVEGLGQGTQFEVLFDSVRQQYPSQRFRARDAHFHAVYELVLVNNRLYQLGVLRDGKYPQPADVEAFFNGFVLLQNPL